MKKYVVKLVETTCFKRAITAESEDRAKEIMLQAWNDGMLETEDFDVELNAHIMTQREEGEYLEYEEE